ncbi:MAG: SGNH/GDSL hydrolase family protein [Gammaproteobacteria bacterium]|nr:SGNH/GDSL hydrolase family protein [Gammaproteobacteria bacterium]
MSKSIALSILVLSSFLVSIVVLEVSVRVLIIPFSLKKLEYFSIENGKLPFFKLVEEFHSDTINIIHGRRELAKRGDRAHRVAFIGDSVTFGSGVNDEKSFVEQIQTGQNIFDAYNLGVPGYGLPEIESVVNTMQHKAYDAVVYTFSANDSYTAMAGLLPLLTNNSNRFLSIEDFQGGYGLIKQFTKDHFKSLILIKSAIGQLNIDDKQSTIVNSETSNHLNCYETKKFHAHSQAIQTNYQVTNQIYSNPVYLNSVKKRLRRIRDRVKLIGSKFILSAAHDFPMVDNNNRLFNIALQNIALDLTIPFIDTFDVYSQNYKQCGFYVDPGHPGVLGSTLLAQKIISELSELKL